MKTLLKNFLNSWVHINELDLPDIIVENVVVRGQEEVVISLSSANKKFSRPKYFSKPRRY